MVIGYDLVKEHQVKVMCAASADMKGGLCVLNHCICKIPHKSTGKGRLPFQPGRLVLCQYLTKHIHGMICLYFPGWEPADMALNLHLPAAAGNAHHRVISEKGVASPFFAALYAFQQVKTAAPLRYTSEQCYGCHYIRVNLAADGNYIVFPRQT